MQSSCAGSTTAPLPTNRKSGAGAFIAPGVCLACSGHAIDPEQRSHGIGTSAPITLEGNVWITHDIPAGVIAAGVPCKVIRPITEKDKFKPEDILF